MTDPNTITRRVDRAMFRMEQEGYRPREITLGAAEQQAMVDWPDLGFPNLLSRDPRKTPAEHLQGMRYKGVKITCEDVPHLLRIEGIWVDPLLELADLPPLH